MNFTRLNIELKPVIVVKKTVQVSYWRSLCDGRRDGWLKWWRVLRYAMASNTVMASWRVEGRSSGLTTSRFPGYQIVNNHMQRVAPNALDSAVISPSALPVEAIFPFRMQSTGVTVPGLLKHRRREYAFLTVHSLNSSVNLMTDIQQSGSSSSIPFLGLSTFRWRCPQILAARWCSWPASLFRYASSSSSFAPAEVATRLTTNTPRATSSPRSPGVQ